MISQSWDKTIAISSHHRGPNSKLSLGQSDEIVWNQQQQPADICWRMETAFKCKTKASKWTRNLVIFIPLSVVSGYFLFLSVHTHDCGQGPSCSVSGLKPCQWMSVTQINSVITKERSNTLSTATVLKSTTKQHLAETKWAVLQRGLLSLTTAAEKFQDVGDQTRCHPF